MVDPEAGVVRLDVPTPADMQQLGARLAPLLRPGDLVVLDGELGAGKTTLTRGLGAALGVRGAVTSPTFVLARVHPGPLPLVHVDAYRVGSALELDDLDLDASLEDSITVVEWGAGRVEGLSPDRLEIRLDRTTSSGPDQGGPDGADARTATIRPVGARWAEVDLRGVLTPRA